MNIDSREIKDVLKSKAHCLSIGFSENDRIVKVLDDMRKQYISKVGLTNYLREMLGELGRTPMQYCALYMEDGDYIDARLEGNYRQSVHRFITNQFQRHGRLPFKVEIRNQSNLNQIEICYL